MTFTVRLAVVLRPEHKVPLLDLGHLEPVVIAPDGGGAHGGAHGAGRGVSAASVGRWTQLGVAHGAVAWRRVHGSAGWGGSTVRARAHGAGGQRWQAHLLRASSGVMIPAST